MNKSLKRKSVKSSLPRVNQCKQWDGSLHRVHTCSVHLCPPVSVFTLQCLADGSQIKLPYLASLLASPTLREQLCYEQEQEQISLGGTA